MSNLIIDTDIDVRQGDTDDDTFISVDIYKDGKYFTTQRIYLNDLFEYGITAFSAKRHYIDEYGNDYVPPKQKVTNELKRAIKCTNNNDYKMALNHIATAQATLSFDVLKHL
jgi:hypothetical protein